MNSKILSLAKKFRLQMLLAALVAIYFLSAPKSEKSFKSVFLNPKYGVDSIELCEKGGALLLEKAGSFWLGSLDLENGKKLCFACDNLLVEKFLSNLRNVSDFYEISNGQGAKAGYGLDAADSFSLTLRQEDKKVLSVNFGSVDSRRRVFFCIEGKEKILAVDSESLSPYLTANENFWASPEIFPIGVVGIDLKYRRGKAALKNGKPLLAEDLNWSGALEKVYDAKDGNVYKALFLPGADGDYYFALASNPSAQRDPVEKAALLKINSVFNVSSWTVERLLKEEY